MIRRPPRSTRTYTLLPYTTLFRSKPRRAWPRGASYSRKRGANFIWGRAVASTIDGGRRLVLKAILRLVSKLPRRRNSLPEEEGTQKSTSRSEERRVGKGCVSKCSSRWSPYH